MARVSLQCIRRIGVRRRHVPIIILAAACSWVLAFTLFAYRVAFPTPRTVADWAAGWEGPGGDAWLPPQWVTTLGIGHVLGLDVVVDADVLGRRAATVFRSDPTSDRTLMLAPKSAADLRAWLLGLTVGRSDIPKLRVPLHVARPHSRMNILTPHSVRAIDTSIAFAPLPLPTPRMWEPRSAATRSALREWLAHEDRRVASATLAQVAAGYEHRPDYVLAVHYGRVHPFVCHEAVPGNTFSAEALIEPAAMCANLCCTQDSSLPVMNLEFPPIIFLDGTVLINTLGVPYPSATGHFVVQTVGRLVRLLASLPRFLAPRVKILIPTTSRVVNLMLARFYALGLFSPAQVLVHQPTFTYVAPLVLTTAAPSQSGEDLELATAVLRAGTGPDDPSDIVFLRRVHHRVLLNHDQLYEDLTARFPDTTIVDFRPEDIDFDAMSDIMRKAAIFLAPHGAGLYHIIFTPPCTPIVEFGVFSGMYWEIAASTGRPYWFIASMSPSPAEVAGVVRDISAWRASPAYPACLAAHYAERAANLTRLARAAPFLLPPHAALTPSPAIQAIISNGPPSAFHYTPPPEP